MRQTRVLAGLLAVAAVTLAAACGSDDDTTTGGAATAPATATAAGPATNTTTTAAAGEVPKAAVLLSVVQDYQEAQLKGIDKVVEAAGGTSEMFNANYDPGEQLAQCKDAVGSGRFNLIILSVLVPPTGVPCVQAAKAAGIPVVALNGTIGTDANEVAPQVDGVVGGVYTTPSGNAKNNLALVEKACEGVDPCKVIVELATPNDPMTNDTAKGLEDLPNVEVVAKFVSGFNPGTVAEKMPAILTANPDANVFMSIADSSALAALPAIEKAGLDQQIKLIGVGGSVDGAKALKDGVLYASSGAWPEQEGATVAEMGVKALNGEPVEPDGIARNDLDGPDLLFQENVDEFTPEWGAKR